MTNRPRKTFERPRRRGTITAPAIAPPPDRKIVNVRVERIPDTPPAEDIRVTLHFDLPADSATAKKFYPALAVFLYEVMPEDMAADLSRQLAAKRAEIEKENSR